ncbi:Disulfide bond formation protein DsbA [Bordetella tumulicola]
MNRRLLIITIGAASLIVFAVAVLSVRLTGAPESKTIQQSVARKGGALLVRFHSPVIGRFDAPITIVEFFDPSCEGCRAFYPHVKKLLKKHPDDVRLVLRYVLLHKGSEPVVRMLEAARKQELFLPVLEAVLNAQPEWHDDPNVAAAWSAAARAGLNEAKARVDMQDGAVSAIIEADAKDVNAVGIKGTPTFFVEGSRLDKLTPQELSNAVGEAVGRHKRQQ